MEIKLSIHAKLKYKVGGQGAGGNWTELKPTKDVTLTLEAEEWDVSTRGSGGFKQSEPTLIGTGIEFDMLWDPTDAAFSAFRTAFFGRSMLGLQVLDAEGGQGLQADFKVFSFTRSEPLAEGLTAAISVKPCASSTPPSWIGA